ncbi:MAG: hypothetical protein EA382_09140 [Spirochaetaceae bacterium]|nr:MAG: hypothetical protein EA382_09140 [Spirochaetaceae bacterium]
MNRLRSTRIGALSTLLLLAAVCFPRVAPALGLEAIESGISQAWTGNAYLTGLPGVEGTITGSEAMPIDGFWSVGARVALLDELLSSNAVLSFTPALEFGLGYYVLFESGRVVPTQIETATGAEDNQLGRGAARILTIRLPLMIAYELRFAGGHTILMGLSPTGVFRVPAGHVERRDDDDDLSDLYGHFYRGARFLMPEVGLGYRFPVSDFFDVTIRADVGASIVDMMDPDLAVWNGMRAALGVRLGFRLPFAGLLRERESVLRVPNERTEPPAAE